MNPLEDIIIEGLLRTNEKGIVYQKEDTKVEFKEKFDRESNLARAKYTKELAAMYNSEGGYLIFGVNDNGELTGLDDFKDIDNAIITDDINSYFSPHFEITSRHFEIGEKVVFVIYVSKRKGIPTVCIKGHQDTLKDSTIYWRYSGQSSPIESGDLINLLNALRGEEIQESVAVAKTALKLQYKPKLSSNGGFGGFDVKLNIRNRGADAKILSVESNTDNITVNFFKEVPFTFSKEAELVLKAKANDGSVMNNRDFEFMICYQDEVGNNYKVTGKYKGPSGKLSDPIEV